LPLDATDLLGTTEAGFGDAGLKASYLPKLTPKFGLVLFLDTFYPTATKDVLGSGKYIASPGATFAFFFQHGKVIFAPSVQQKFSYAGDSDRQSVNQSLVDFYLVWRPTMNSWITFDPQFVYDHEDGKFFNQTEIEIGRLMFGGGQHVPQAGSWHWPRSTTRLECGVRTQNSSLSRGEKGCTYRCEYAGAAAEEPYYEGGQNLACEVSVTPRGGGDRFHVRHVHHVVQCHERQPLFDAQRAKPRVLVAHWRANGVSFRAHQFNVGAHHSLEDGCGFLPVSAPAGLTSLVRSSQDEGRPAHSASVSAMTCLPTIARCSSTIAPDQSLELSSIPAKRFTNT
jgi:hypothetical protein